MTERDYERMVRMLVRMTDGSCVVDCRRGKLEEGEFPLISDQIVIDIEDHCLFASNWKKAYGALADFLGAT